MTLQYTARPALYSDGTTKAVVGDWVTIYVNGDPDHYDARIVAPITRVCGGYRYVLQYTGPVLEQADVLSVVVQSCCDAVASQAAEDLAAGLATKAPLSHTHLSAHITDAASTPAVGKLAKWPSSGTFPPSAHSHPISGVVGLQSALDSKLPASVVSPFSVGLLEATDAVTARSVLGALQGDLDFILITGDLTSDGYTPVPFSPQFYTGLFNGRPRFAGEDGSYTQWNAGWFLRSGLYTLAGWVSYDDVMSPEQATTWIPLDDSTGTPIMELASPIRGFGITASKLIVVRTDGSSSSITLDA